MPLYTKRSQASVTSVFAPSTEPLDSRNSKLTRFRVLPTYPSPHARRELTSEASSSSFRTSYILATDSTSDTDSFDSTVSDVSREFWQKRELARGNFTVDESSDSDSMKSDTISNMSYSSIHDTPMLSRQRHEAYRFTTEGTGAILGICKLRTGQCWITRHNDKVIYLYHRNGEKKEWRTVGSKIAFMCVRDDKAVLAVPQLSQTIFKLAPSGRLSAFVSFELEIGGMCATSRNEILVTTMPLQKSHKKGPRPRKVPSVLRMNHLGEVIWSIRCKGTDPFVKPSKICVNVNGDICVIDHEPSREQLVILSPDGEQKKRYFGIQDKILVHPFGPKDVCCDLRGFIYIADLNNSAVHVLDRHGNFKQFLFTLRDGNQYPVAITREADGFVWVGLSSGAIRVYDTEEMHKNKTKAK